MSRYIKYYVSIGYATCDMEGVIDFPEDTTDKEIYEYVHYLGRDNAESFSYMFDSEEEMYEAIETEWEEVSKEEFDDYLKREYGYEQ